MQAHNVQYRKEGPPAFVTTNFAEDDAMHVIAGNRRQAVRKAVFTRGNSQKVA